MLLPLAHLQDQPVPLLHHLHLRLVQVTHVTPQTSPQMILQISPSWPSPHFGCLSRAVFGSPEQVGCVADDGDDNLLKKQNENLVISQNDLIETNKLQADEISKLKEDLITTNKTHTNANHTHNTNHVR